MAGTKAGAAKSVAKILARDPDFFSRIGKVGGRNGTTGGFAAFVPCDCAIILGDHHKAQCAGYVGGIISKRSKRVVEEHETATRQTASMLQSIRSRLHI